jgi:hypothetical protein
MPTKQIREIERTLTQGLSVIRRTRDRSFLREAVMRIRQLRGILELRSH